MLRWAARFVRDRRKRPGEACQKQFTTCSDNLREICEIDEKHAFVEALRFVDKGESAFPQGFVGIGRARITGRVAKRAK